MKKTKGLKRVISLMAAITIMLSLMAVTVLAGTPTDAKNSVVLVEGAHGYGSGFAIGEVGKPVQYIVTNNHVVEGDLGYTTAMVGFDVASNDYVSANVYFYDAERDVAVLKLPQPTDKRKAMILCPMKYVDPDDEFAALGYPGNQNSDHKKFNMDDITITKGGIKKTDRYGGQDVYMLDLDITNGNSGGPLVNSKGEVVGINTFGDRMSGENYAIAIDELLAVLDTDRIPVTIHGEINWILIAIIAIAVIVIVLVLVLVLRKKPAVNYSNNEANDVQVAEHKAQPAVNNAPSARVVALGGTLNGKRYTVSGVIKIGRDASKCGIAYPVNTQGVSGVHCEIAFDGAVCYVKDLGSSYGTFTIDGKKLEANVAQVLKDGDKFYLASPENTFEVRF